MRGGSEIGMRIRDGKERKGGSNSNINGIIFKVHLQRWQCIDVIEELSTKSNYCFLCRITMHDLALN